MQCQSTVWDTKPQDKGSPINWVELKTSAEIRHNGDMENFHRKLMKYWIQSFLLGVPKIIVGFRTRDGILVDLKEIETHNIPQTVNARPNPAWNADICVNFAAAFLECRPIFSHFSSCVYSSLSIYSYQVYKQGSCRRSMTRASGEYLDEPIRPSLKYIKQRKQAMAIS